MTTYRERREARAERLEGWADKREAKADAAIEAASAKAAMIPFGQPMMPDHHSYGRDRRFRDGINAGFSRGFADAAKAKEMRSKAANITAAAEGAIYSDDPDAVERLEEKLADLLAQRAAIVAYNKTARKGAPDLALLPPRLRAQVDGPVTPANRSMPAYVLSNLSGTIGATRKRLEGLR